MEHITLVGPSVHSMDSNEYTPSSENNVTVFDNHALQNNVHSTQITKSYSDQIISKIVKQPKFFTNIILGQLNLAAPDQFTMLEQSQPFLIKKALKALRDHTYVEQDPFQIIKDTAEEEIEKKVDKELSSSAKAIRKAVSTVVSDIATNKIPLRNSQALGSYSKKLIIRFIVEKILEHIEKYRHEPKGQQLKTVYHNSGHHALFPAKLDFA